MPVIFGGYSVFNGGFYAGDWDFQMKKRKDKIKRTNCACEKCRHGCQTLTGYLLPEDLPGYMSESWQGEHGQTGRAVFWWAEKNLLASEGALVARGGEFFRIPTLVPATRENGHCVHYVGERCAVHKNSPAGCRLFNACALGQKAAKQETLANALQHRLAGFWANDPTTPAESLYKEIWGHLWAIGKRRENVAELGKRYSAGVK